MEPPVAYRPTLRRIQRSVATGFRAYMPPPSGPSRLSSYPPRPLADLPEIFLSPCPPCELVRTETWGHSTLWPAPSSSPHGERLGIHPYRAVFPGVIFLYAIYRPLSIQLLTFVRLLSIFDFHQRRGTRTAWQTPASSGKRRGISGIRSAWRPRQRGAGAKEAPPQAQKRIAEPTSGWFKKRTHHSDGYTP